MTFWPRSWPSGRPWRRGCAAAALVLGEGLDQRLDLRDVLVHGADLALVDAGNGLDLGLVAAEHLLHGVRHLADGGLARAALIASASRLPLPAAPAVNASRAAWTSAGLRFLAQAAELLDLRGAHRGIVHLEDVDGLSAVRRNLLTPMTDCTPESMRACVLAAASSIRSFGIPASMALAMPAERLDLLDVLPRLRREIGGQPLDIERTAPGVDDAGRAAFLLQEELGVAGDAGGEVGRQGQRLVEGVGVQRLGVALRRCHGLDLGAHDVVEHILRRQRPAGGLAVGAQRQGLVALRVELLDELGPKEACGRSFATSMKKFMPMAQKKERRGANWSTVMPAAMPARIYSTPSASV